ncbi:transposase IS3 family protein [Ruegeria lacuscaerulensis ITI-1157]|nr:transposase IS3 family protein [Ruegeria lacuscaerulensis ITI-1157]SHK16392.1 hypothetical protein SAMN05444404_3403 [Ruegeria lacuscaerulensis ITI-1157]
MRQKPGTKQSHGEKVVKDIRRATRKQYTAEEKIRIVLDGLKAEARIACFEFIEGWYNPSRRHSALGYKSPINYERTAAEGLESLSP